MPVYVYSAQVVYLCANFYFSIYVRIPMPFCVLNECVGVHMCSGIIVCRCVKTRVFHCVKNPIQLVLITI